jgi:hypothetical protein
MASTYSPLKIELITTGEQSATWGTTTNVNLGTAIEEAIVGSADVTFSSANVTLTLTDTNGTQAARNLRLRLIGTTGGARNLIVPSIEKQYIVLNECSDAITVKNTTGTGVAVPPSLSAVLYNDGTNVTCASIYSTSVVTPSLAATDAVFLNALPVLYGGTGVTTSTGTGAGVHANSPALTTPNIGTPSAGVLTSCTGLPLTTGVTGTLPVANGGTGSTSAATGTGGVVLANSPTLVTPALGTPSALVGTNITGTAAGLSIGGNLTGASPTAATQTTGTNNTTVATTAFVQTALQLLYPVGAIYSSTAATNPGTSFGFGTWVAFGAGRVMIGNGGGYSAGATGGSADAVVVSHTHTASSAVTDPGHAHNVQLKFNNGGGDGYSVASGALTGSNLTLLTPGTNTATTGITVATTITSAGVSGTNANLQPYVVVYMWNRTA